VQHLKPNENQTQNFTIATDNQMEVVSSTVGLSTLFKKAMNKEDERSNEYLK